MFSQTASLSPSVEYSRAGSISRRLVLAALIVASGASVSRAVPYDFLSVSGNNVAGNGASTTFTSNNKNGVITVSHVFSSPLAVGYADNNNALIYPSEFSILFPGTGKVQGHLAMTVYGDPNSPIPGGNIYTSQVIFDLTGYKANLGNLKFGIWNTTDEVPLPAYNVKMLDVNSKLVSGGLSVFGNQDNQWQVAGKHSMQYNTINGDITAPTLINAFGTHTDAIFLDGIPPGTQQIIVTGNLPPLNNIGDGVGYYFAEPVPEPSTIAMSTIGAAGLAWAALRRRRRRGQSTLGRV
ncbi:MAG: PEP-CTERM sorting domain-containing protein [Pirellulales bacterium]|nr:PEP-CTERM sorting domain-containing protein [Pirellulales bacterium]